MNLNIKLLILLDTNFKLVCFNTRVLFIKKKYGAGTKKSSFLYTVGMIQYIFRWKYRNEYFNFFVLMYFYGKRPYKIYIYIKLYYKLRMPLKYLYTN
jgi:hypothetical protein